MKRLLYSLVISLLVSLPALAQNEGISFQGLARNAAGEVLVSQKVSLRLSILLDSESGTVAYVETRQVTTNPQGIFAVVLGDANTLTKSTDFSTINWTPAPKFIKVEMDPNAGTNFTAMGTSKLQAVPFAFYAYGVDAENVEGILPVGSGGTGVASIVDLKTSLGVDQVDNTADANKPLSAASQAALSTKANTTDVTTSLALKVDKVTGKGLSSNDFTTAEKTKLAEITGNVTGPTGPQGPIGLTGPAGVQGPIGPVGPAGSDGAVGAQGLPGEAGPRGLPGTNGIDGATGSQGPIGLTGPAGVQGPIGPVGPAGNDGAVGAQGLPGEAGPRGLPGINGTNGIDGVTGPQGPIGLTGPAGVQGPIGPVGPAGSDGAVGPQGPIGLTGPAGVGGVTTAGTNITLSGSGTLASPYVVSANIPAAAAGTLTGNSLNATVTSSSLTSVGTLANLIVTNPIVGSLTGSSGSTTGNAATATKLATPRNINGEAFDGSADITVPAAAGTLSGTTLNPTVTGSSLTSMGTLTSATVNGKVIVGASSAASASAVLEASSTMQGFLPPRMTRAQRIAIVNPTAGLIVWCTNCGTSGELQVNNGTSWTNMIGSAAIGTIPDMPTIPVATAGNAQASVAFTIPVSDGGSAITGYTVTSSPGNFTATGASSPLVVTGLTNLTSYTFTVVATNAVGNSIPSVASAAVIPGTVIGAGGRIWMDRNLGATQVATSSTDAASYGYLYQWGRRSDGHQLRTSNNLFATSNTDQPNYDKFFNTNLAGDNWDWRKPQNVNLWQGVNGVNNPCPTGYRIPTQQEWVTEHTTWISQDAAGAFDSPLKLPMAGFRNGAGTLSEPGGSGRYWSSTVDGINTLTLHFPRSPVTHDSRRGGGLSVRCIKD